MRGVHINVRTASGSSLSGKLFGILAGIVLVTCILLFVAGLWLLLASSASLVLIAGLLLAFLPRRARKKLLGRESATRTQSEAPK
jgi:hypothetical protein